MKKSLLLFSFIVCGFFAEAQSFGNEWITDPTKPYYRIDVPVDGVYRIPGAIVNSYFGPSVQKQNFVLYNHGKTVPMYISGTGNTLGNSDYIEFYGKHNTGEMDAQLYRNPDDQMNPTYSMFTNTSAYYLAAITPALPHPRYTDTSNNINTSLTPEKYFMYLSEVNYPTGMYYEGKYVSQGNTELYKSTFDAGEGYTYSQYFGGNGAQNFTAFTPGVYTQGPTTAVFKTRYANNSAFEDHQTEVRINNNLVYSQPTGVSGFNYNNITTTFPVSQLVSGNSIITYIENITGLSSQKQNIVGALSIDYPRDFNFSNANIGGQPFFYFQLEASTTNKYLEIQNFNDGGTTPVLYDITNGQIYRSAQLPGSNPLKFNLLPSAQKRELVLRSDIANTSYYTVTNLKLVNFVDYSKIQNQGQYFIITDVQNQQLFPTSGTNYIEEYRIYRDNVLSPTTGKFTQCRIADVNVLYEQFGYGITKSPLGLRNFINYISTDTGISLKAKFVFLIGKGREARFYRNGGAAYNQCLVPTFGYPGSDNLLAATQQSDVPNVAIGRLAASDNNQVRDYLNKIKEYEEAQNEYVCNQDIPSKEWQKEVLHFSGGTTPNEQGKFKGFVNGYKAIAEDSLWGVNVTTFSKDNNAPISTSLADVIKAKINSGVSWVTFFGHSATGAFDFSIDEPENYTNAGKYPIMLSNGCFSGFIHDATVGFSERFVLQPNKGMIAFMATSSLSVDGGLNVFSNQLYKNTCVRDYNQPLGIALKQTLEDIFTNSSTSDITQMVGYEMTLHGDPALKPNHYPKPDYAVDASSVYTTPLTITPGLNNFDVNVVITNLGKCSVDDTLPSGTVVKSKINVSLKRTVFDASGNPVYYYYNKNIQAPFFKDTVTFTLPVNISTLGYGQNLFEPYVDAEFKIDEMAECNNSLTTPVSAYIQNDDIIPIYPYEFAIVPQKGVTLKASTINPFAPVRPYRFQIDTNELFNSPKLKETVVTQIGGVVHCPTDVAYYEKDSTVFYWRVKFDSTGKEWHYSSFIYLQGEFPGWNQSHQFQYQKDSYERMSLDANDRVFKFPSNNNQIHVRTGKANAVGGNVDYETLGWDYNNYNEYRYRMGGCGYANPFQGYSGGLTFAVIDHNTGLPRLSLNWNADNWGDQYGNIHCSNHAGEQAGFDFNTTGYTSNPDTSDGYGWDALIANFINSIQNNDYVLVYTVNNPPYTSWSPTLVNALGQLGIVTTQFTNGNLNGQFVYFTQKGNANYNPFFATSDGTSSIIDVNIPLAGNWYQGNFTSPKIGPTKEWGSVHWVKQPAFATPAENPLNDKDTLDIIGVRYDGVEEVLLKTTNPNNLISTTGLNTIFNEHYPVGSTDLKYPYLKLRLSTNDSITKTPTQLYYWRVLYKKPPEAAINPAAHFVPPNTVNIGSKLHFEIGLENVTDVPMDSMLTKYTIRDAALNTYNYYIRYDTLGGLDTMHLVFDKLIDQNSFIGLNKIIIEANPDDDQIEQYHFNNIAELNFSAVADKINPLLDVTFDNQHIMNGDIVSAKPNILIALRDENKFLALNDTSLIQVYLKYPGDATPRRMSFDDIVMKFYPADSTQLAHGNKAQIELKPTFTIDGTYELLIKDRDRSGNNSATNDATYQGTPATFFDYKISFEVITKPMVTNVLNYPNPFTTSTKFVFTITGSEVPDFMKIQILTIKGTVVKEIFKEELGPLRVGRNITEYAWDGRDQYGDLLANGIYFYHVSTRLDDKQMDAMGMSYDKYFKKGFGKMAIIR